ncbi:MAG: hypothetical protein V2I33_01045 [Kangiellaceae bacterium]|jgi:hypothetical protein|nr:hypothetical protein [Kangiellaceae bacterium]
MQLSNDDTIKYNAIKKIKALFGDGKTFQYENSQNTVTCELSADGISVDCLGDSPFLPWAVFWQAVDIIIKEGGEAKPGKAIGKGIKLGSDELPANSIEGYVAMTVYGKEEGISVFRRISPITHLLIQSGICEKNGQNLKLL